LVLKDDSEALLDVVSSGLFWSWLDFVALREAREEVSQGDVAGAGDPER
jgi:hypothetical protein